jgi:hypothetical protein
LAELLEDRLVLVWWDARTRVPHTDLQQTLAGAARLHDHFALSRELERVAAKVHQDLTHTLAIEYDF